MKARGGPRVPVALAILVVGGTVAVIAGLRPLVRALAPHVGIFPAATVRVAALSLLGLGIVALSGRWAGAGLTRPAAWTGAAAVVPLGLYTALGVLGLAAGPRITDPGTVAWVGVYVLLIGLSEEVLFRGVIFDLLAERGPLAAVAGSSVLFGLVHLNNAVHGADPGFVALQVVAATGTGVFFAAVRIRQNTIVPLIYAHAMTDLTPFLVRGPGFGGPGTPLIEFVPFVGYSWVFAGVGIWLLRDRLPVRADPPP